MKKTFFMAAFACCMAILSSCGGGGLSLTGPKNPADKAASYDKAIELVKKNVDADRFKIYELRFVQGEQLSNDLMYVDVKMVNKDNQPFSQVYYLNGNVGDLDLESLSLYVTEFDKIKGIDVNKLDTKTIEAQLAEAAKMVPEGHTYKSVSNYEIAELLPRTSSMLNKGREIGKQEATFSICYTEDGKETETSGGQVTHLYYESDFIVNPDGTLSVKD